MTLVCSYAQTLTDEDYKLLKEYADACEVEDAVGQLFMIGLPTDIAQYKQDKVIDKMIDELHIGWIFVNTYNYYWNRKINPSKNDLLSDVANFYNKIQDKAVESGLRIPVGFSANFEGGNYSSIGGILFQPPEALTIGSSNNEVLVSKIGNLVGYQLRQLGIHILFGPVLDVDSTSTREFVTRTQNRIFAGTPDLVTNIASHYLSGLKRHGMIIIAKHFPGYGDVYENPHNDAIPESRDSIENLRANLIPYRSLQPNIDGIMTAHMSLNILQPNKSKMVTFSPLIANNLYRQNAEIQILETNTITGLGYRDKIAVTDDLADMGAVRKHMKSNNFNWDDIVVQAFEAGHDILLFSVIEKERTPSHKFSGYGDFDITVLEEIIKNFVNYIKSSKDIESRFRVSLYRNLILKAKIAKFHNQPVYDLLHGIGMEGWRLGAIKEDVFRSVPIDEIGFEDSDTIINEMLCAGFLEINKASEWDLENVSADINISVFTDASVDASDKRLLEYNFSNITFYTLPRQKTREQYQNIYRQLETSLESSERIYFSVSTQDDANIIKSAYEQHRNLVREKLIILIHNTPTLLESNILQSVTIIGCFSSHYNSYVLDFDVILGKVEVNPLSNLTISLGSNGSVYDHKKSNFTFTLNNSYIPIPYYATSKEKELTEANEKLRHDIEIAYHDLYHQEIRQNIIIFSAGIIIILLIVFLLSKRNKTTVRSIKLVQDLTYASQPTFIRARAALNIDVIIFFVSSYILLYLVGEKYSSSEVQQSIISILFYCIYQYPWMTFISILSLLILILIILNFPVILRDFMNIFLRKKN
jgi:beta-glucosidase-like glycosyl hydrolase